jgi:hypothetical protein
MSAQVGLSDATRLPVRPVAIVIAVFASARQAETLLTDLEAGSFRSQRLFNGQPRHCS